AGTIEVRDDSSTQAKSLLTVFARSMLSAGSVGSSGLLSGGEPCLLFSPEHARIIARDKTRAAAQTFLFENARLPVSALTPEKQVHLAQHGASGKLGTAMRASDIMLVVVGGVGYKST